MSVTLATHCHIRDRDRLHNSFNELVSSHNYLFDEIQIAYQRCSSDGAPLNVKVIEITDDDYEPLLARFGIPHNDPVLSELTHGWNAPHYYENHIINHLAHIVNATSDYILFTDADCKIIHQPNSWVNKAIQLLERSDVLIVSPSDGGHEFIKILPDGTRLTDTVSQQVFLAKREVMLKLNWLHLPWDGQFDAPYGPFGEFYALYEGHLWRWMRKYNLYRAMLPEEYRYWHGQWH